MMSEILPFSLVDALRREHYLPVIGWGYPDLAPGPRGWSGTTPADHPRSAAGIVDSGHERFCMESEARRWLTVAGPHLWPLYQAVASLPISYLLTLTPDLQLIQILKIQDPAWIVAGTGQTEFLEGQRIILPLGGLSSDPASILIGPADYVGLARRRRNLWELSQGYAARSPLLLLGFDPADQGLRHVVAGLRPVSASQNGGWLLCKAVSARDRESYQALGFEVVEAPLATLLRAIVRVSFDRLKEEGRRSIQASGRNTPYKNLNYFEPHDTDIFYGRRVETQRLVTMVSSHRLVVATGPSGAGKTSLLNAGLIAANADRIDQVGLYVRCGIDPIAAITQAITDSLPLDQATYADTEALTSLLVCLREASQPIPLIILDQAEELFTRIGKELREELFLAIRQCLTRSELLARFVVSLRDDYLPRLAELREIVPSLLQNVFYLSELSHQGALEAMRNPAKRAGVEFDRSLASQILRDLDDLGIGTLAPPQIQIVCSRLFEHRRGRAIDLAIYERLGGAQEILRRFLSEELRGLDQDENAAELVLKALVTSEGTKDVLTVAEIARRARLPEQQTGELLLHLRDKSRLLRGVRQDREYRFELAHEYLTTEIWSWMSEEDKKRREIEELLARELRSWNRFRHLRLGVDRLQVFESNAELLDANEEGLALLLLSAVRHQRSVELWTEQVRELGAIAQERVANQLFDYFHDRDQRQRRDAAEVIAQLDPAPLIRTLESQASDARKTAIEMVGGIELEAATDHLVSLLGDTNPEVRLLACGALGEINNAAAVAALADATRSDEDQLAAAAVRALGRTSGSLAAQEITRALSSGDNLLLEAAKDAVRNAPIPDLIQRLLLDDFLSGNARKAVWDVLLDTPKTLTSWDSIIDRMPKENLVIALLFCQRYLSTNVEAVLVAIKNRGGKTGWKARQLLRELYDSVRKVEQDKDRIREIISGQGAISQTAQLLGDPHSDTFLGTVEGLIEGGSIVAVLLPDLLELNRSSVTAGALMALFSMNATVEIHDRLLLRALRDNDASARYWACLAAAKLLQTGCVEAISGLSDDLNEPAWHIPWVGRAVRDAAAYTLDELRPATRVWRKPFQVSFRDKSATNPPESVPSSGPRSSDGFEHQSGLKPKVKTPDRPEES